MTSIILGIMGLIAIVVLWLTHHVAVYDTLIRRVSSAKSEMVSVLTRLTRHLHHPPARWAAA